MMQKINRGKDTQGRGTVYPLYQGKGKRLQKQRRPPVKRTGRSYIVVPAYRGSLPEAKMMPVNKPVRAGEKNKT
eukprot:1153379-Pelagomonas_calceolata.AAC.12